VVPQVEQTVSMIPQVSQVAVSQVAQVVPTISVAPKISTLAVFLNYIYYYFLLLI